MLLYLINFNLCVHSKLSDFPIMVVRSKVCGCCLVCFLFFPTSTD